MVIVSLSICVRFPRETMDRFIMLQLTTQILECIDVVRGLTEKVARVTVAALILSY